MNRTRAAAAAAARAEYRALLDMLTGLRPHNWAQPTECAPWAVRELAAHIAGAAEESVRLRVQLRHLRTARRRGGVFIDALNAQQIADRADRTPGEILAELAELGRRAPGTRARTPWFIRNRALPAGAGGLPGDTMGYLLDVIYTRDIWMHRIDIARATGCELPTSPAEHTIIGLVMADLQRAWTGPACRLRLRGRTDGSWDLGADPALPRTEFTLDAIAICRLLSGRSDETGLDSTIAEAIRHARVLF